MSPNGSVARPPPARSYPPVHLYVNGVRQEARRDYEVTGGALLFSRPLVKEGRLGFWKWFWGAFGIGSYARNDVVDVAWDSHGSPRVAHALDIEPPAA